MAQDVGRSLVLRRVDGGTLVKFAAVKTKSVAIASEPIDTTNDDDEGWRTLLGKPGQRQLDLSFSGVADNDDFLERMLAAAPTQEAINILFPSGATIEGQFEFTSLTLTGEYNQAVTFEGEMQSSGALTFTGAGS